MSRMAGLVMSLILLGAILIGVQRQNAAAAVTLPTGFQEQIVFAGLTEPTNIEFASDGRVFVAERSGLIKVFDDFADATPSVYADLRANVNDLWDRGLLGMALHPSFPEEPWIYVLYTYDAPPNETAPYWHDNCDAVGGSNEGRCVVTGRLSRLNASGAEEPLLHGWCQQYPSHSIGDLKFGADGMLYVSSGDGASFGQVDFGQLLDPPYENPCGDPVDQGGALRSQDVRSDGDPAGLNGTVLRLDPETGLAAPGNPYAMSADPIKRRVVAYGLRNPYRFTLRPGTNEAWLGDVGWNTWEDIERLADPLAPAVANFGWPCYEGAGHEGGYDGWDVPLCESLYPIGQTAPYYTYNHSSAVVPGENCATGGDSITGLAFYPSVGGSYPADYAGALFFADYARRCIWAMRTATPGGLPSPANIQVFAQEAALPVDLAIGPGGELYYVDYGGSVRRIRYFPANQPPVAVIQAAPENGYPPLTVEFDASASSDNDPADAGRLTYQWDFTNDGSFDASTKIATFTYPSFSDYTARLRVTDSLGAWDEETILIRATGFPPIPSIDTPAAGITWAAGDVVSFSGHATDPEDPWIPASGLSWQLRLQHCATVNNCHTHIMQSWNGTASGSFVAPDHEYPSYLELSLTATDSAGQSSSLVRRLDPQTVMVSVASKPAGVALTVGSHTAVAPYGVPAIRGSTKTISAPQVATVDGVTYTFVGWSDRGAIAHAIETDSAATYRATYVRCGGWILFIRPRACAPLPPLIDRRSTRPFG